MGSSERAHVSPAIRSSSHAPPRSSSARGRRGRVLETSLHPRDELGVLMALALLSTWGVSLGILLRVSLEGSWTLLWAPVAIAWMSWLFTGLFITGHDAMHGAIAPRWPRVNHALGAVAVGAYAMFDYRRLRRAHREHHAQPARPGDPDWHDGQHPHPVAWFWAFMSRYLQWGQLVRLVLLFGIAQEWADSPNVLLFWALPALTSTLQLFYFGTYLPHREPPGGHTHRHRATSLSLGPVLSLVTCFHFGGYHREHHENPRVPWWRLPSLSRRRLDPRWG